MFWEKLHSNENVVICEEKFNKMKEFSGVCEKLDDLTEVLEITEFLFEGVIF